MTFADLTRRRIRGLGWRPDLPDQRDLHLAEFIDGLDHLRPVPEGLDQFSLRGQEPEPSYDQGQLGSCTGNGIAFAVQFERARQKLDAFRPSRLAIYYGERLIEGTVGQDAGAMIRDGIKVVHASGAGPEAIWPYDISKFTEPPPQAYFDAAAKDLVLRYARAPRPIATIKLLIYNGFPVVKGFTVYESFESQGLATTGLMPTPQRSEQVIGGHCTVWMGWNDKLVMPNTSSPGALEDRNSWGTSWGDNGHFWMPYGFAESRNCSDLWTIRLVESS